MTVRRAQSIGDRISAEICAGAHLATALRRAIAAADYYGERILPRERTALLARLEAARLDLEREDDELVAQLRRFDPIACLELQETLEGHIDPADRPGAPIVPWWDELAWKEYFGGNNAWRAQYGVPPVERFEPPVAQEDARVH